VQIHFRSPRLRALRELSATHCVPPVGVIFLGAGNDISQNFGWVSLRQDVVDSDADIVNMFVQSLEMEFYSEWSMWKIESFSL